MPVGPSHSGRGGGSSRGGSFGGGGSRSGGSSFGRRSSSTHTHEPYHNGFHFGFGPRRFHFFGRTVVLTSGMGALVSILLVFCVLFLFMTFATSTTVSSYEYSVETTKNEIAIIESDADYFENLIENAKNGTSGYYITNATFGDKVYSVYPSNPTSIGAYEAFTKDGIEWYFVVYNFTNEVTNSTMRGTTYTQFSAGQLTARDGKIEIAYTNTDGEWWSINTNYSLEYNQDYKLLQEDLSSYESQLKSAKTRKAFFIVVIVAVVALLVFIFIKKSKKTQEEDKLEQQKTQAEVDEAKAKADMAKRQAKQYGRTCEYCGNDIPDGASKCPSCGSSNFE